MSGYFYRQGNLNFQPQAQELAYQNNAQDSARRSGRDVKQKRVASQ